LNGRCVVVVLRALVVNEKHMLTLVRSSWLIMVKSNCEGLIIE